MRHAATAGGSDVRCILLLRCEKKNAYTYMNAYIYDWVTFLYSRHWQNNCNKKINMWDFPSWLSGNKSDLVSMRMHVQSLASFSGLRIQHCRELCCRLQCSLDPELLWLWCRAAAVALIWPLALHMPLWP